MEQVIDDKNISSNQVLKEDNLSKQSTLFTKREWILRYAAPWKALMFMAGPMIIITLVNAMYGIIDKQLTLNYAMDQVVSMVKTGKISGQLSDGTPISTTSTTADLELFAKQLINLSTQYSNTIIFILQAMSLLTSVGTAVKWGQAMGRRNKEEMDSILITGLMQTLVMSIFGVLILHFIAPYILCAQANTSYANRNNSLQFILANDYIQKFIWGFPLLAFATFLSTLLRTEGKVWWIIAINLISVGINMGVGEAIMKAMPADQKMAGAVYGSMVAWSFLIISALAIVSASKNTLLKPNLKRIKLTKTDAISIWSSGFSPFLSNFMFGASNFLLTLLITVMHPIPPADQTSYIIINFNNAAGALISTSYISVAIRVLSAGSPWSGILWAPITGMMQGGNANYAYNKGAGNRFRMIQTMRIHMIINITWGFFVLAICAAFGGQMLEMFDGPKEQHWWFFCMFSAFFMAGWNFTAMSLFQGSGQAKYAAILSLSRAFVSMTLMSVIGWLIARGSWNDAGHYDWIIFLFYGWAELPAAIAATILLYLTARRVIKAYQLNDIKDEFTPPSLLVCALNEVTIAEQSDSARINKEFEHRIHKIEVSDDLNKEFKINHLNEERENHLNKIVEKSRIKRDKAISKYKFNNESWTNTIERQEIELRTKYNKRKDKIKSDDLKSMQKLENWHAKQNAKLEIKCKKVREDIIKRQNGDIKPTVFNIMFALTEPQPINQSEMRKREGIVIR